MITYDLHVLVGAEDTEKKAAIKCHDTGVNLRIWPEILTQLSAWRSTKKPYTIPPGSTAVLKVAKPDKTYVLTDGKIESGSIYFEPHPQSFTAPGTAQAEVNIYGNDGRRLTTATFLLTVTKESACDCEQESGSYVDILGEQIKAIKDAETAATEAADKAVGAASHPPKLSENVTWLVWNVETGEYEDTGISGLGQKGDPGEPGAPGKDGYTPKKGVDYYTEADKADMVQAVLAALPTYNGEVEEV